MLRTQTIVGIYDGDRKIAMLERDGDTWRLLPLSPLEIKLLRDVLRLFDEPGFADKCESAGKLTAR